MPAPKLRVSLSGRPKCRRTTPRGENAYAAAFLSASAVPPRRGCASRRALLPISPAREMARMRSRSHRGSGGEGVAVSPEQSPSPPRPRPERTPDGGFCASCQDAIREQSPALTDACQSLLRLRGRRSCCGEGNARGAVAAKRRPTRGRDAENTRAGRRRGTRAATRQDSRSSEGGRVAVCHRTRCGSQPPVGQQPARAGTLGLVALDVVKQNDDRLSALRFFQVDVPRRHAHRVESAQHVEPSLVCHLVAYLHAAAPPLCLQMSSSSVRLHIARSGGQCGAGA